MSATTASTTPRAAAWRLDLPASSHPAESALLPDDGRKTEEESIIGEDERTLVDFADIAEGGKYRSVVKIQARFENTKTGKEVWMMGTGWLIRPDLLVTAGHVVYDWGHKFGAATQIKCYIGYNGRNSVKSATVQARYGLNVVSTAEWIEAPNNRVRDLAFIQVDRPFTGNLRTFNFINTPTPADPVLLGVVGYPGDKALKDGSGTEYGAQMYEEYARIKFDVAASARHMIEYTVSTYGGQSGAPILRKQDGQLTSIGTHCYGGGGDESNSGNSISGQWGNNYEAFISLFNADKSPFKTAKGVQFVETQKRAPIAAPAPAPVAAPVSLPVRPVTVTNGYTAPATNGSNGFNSNGFTPVPRAVPTIQAGGRSIGEEEGFFDVLKQVARIGSKLVPAASSMLGPVGTIVGTAAGGILGHLAGAESIGDMSGGEGASERAVLAEAALQAVLAMEESPELAEVTQKMKNTWTANTTNVDALAKALTPALTECALDLASDQLHNGPQTKPIVLLPARKLDVDRPESTGDDAAFVEGLFGPTRPIAGEEGIMDWFGKAMQVAVQVGKPLVSQVANQAIQQVTKKLNNVLGGQESVVDSPLSRHEEATKLLIKRSLMADAALQAVMTLPKDKLKKITMAPNHGVDQAEGIFDFIKTTVQKIGPSVIDVAQSAAKKYLPTIIDAASKKITNKLGLSAESAAGAAPGAPAPPALKKKPSLLEMLHNNTHTTSIPIQGSVKVSDPEESPARNDVELVDVGPLFLSRKMTWEPSNEWQKDWDSNDDGPVVMSMTPPDF